MIVFIKTLTAQVRRKQRLRDNKQNGSNHADCSAAMGDCKSPPGIASPWPIRYSPPADPKVMGVALKQLTTSMPQAAQLKIADFIDRSLISELENEGFISKIYDGR